MKYKIKKLDEEILRNYSGLFKSLQNMTFAPEINLKESLEIFEKIKAQNGNIYVVLTKKEIIGTAKILIEQKFIRGGAKVGHIEDVSIHEDYTGKGIGKRLLEKCMEKAKKENCYKIILNCNESLINFYKKDGFKEHSICMRKDL